MAALALGSGVAAFVSPPLPGGGAPPRLFRARRRGHRADATIREQDKDEDDKDGGNGGGGYDGGSGDGDTDHTGLRHIRRPLVLV
eukprot:5839871-Pyramimonas_sp.AAC.1